MSILSLALQERYFDQFKGYVFFGVRTFRDAFFLRELSGFVQAFPGRLTVGIALSDEPVPEEARGAYPALEFDHGLVHEVAARRMKANYHNIRGYLAGPPPAVDAAIRTLIVEAKLTTDNIVYDKFSEPRIRTDTHTGLRHGGHSRSGMKGASPRAAQAARRQRGADYFAYQ
jgi:toluene monooxygenase electron transfer component